MPDPSIKLPSLGTQSAEPDRQSADVATAVDGLTSGDANSSDSCDAVIEISGSGNILNVLNWRAKNAKAQADLIAGRRLDDVWPAEISLPIIENARRAIRSQQVRRLKLDYNNGANIFEAILIVQGRDRVMVVLRDVSDIEGKVARLERLAYLDSVTGLPNLEWLMAELAVLTERLQIHGGRAALICIDVTNLRIAERAYFDLGRVVVLKEVAQRLLDGLRGANEDVAVDNERYSAVARIDAQRFAIIVPRIETGGDAVAIADRLTELLEQPIDAHGKEFTLRIASGLALYPQDGRTADELYENGGIALAEAIYSQTSSQKMHSGTVRMRALERDDLESELKSALEKEEFSLTYLPIVKAADGEVVTAEALLRWPTRSFGGQPVSEILNVAEYTGVILPLGTWVFARAFEQLLTWHGDSLAKLGVAVNVSAQEFARGNLVERTERALRETGLAAENVTIEITEQVLFRDALNGFEVCRGLKALGVHMSVDDFGKGVCPFEHLAGSPIDFIKIHMALVARAAENDRSRAACAAIVAMAHELGFRVVAEGVDTEERAATLREVGCDFLQGFLFSTPLNAEAFADYVAQSAAGPAEQEEPAS